MKSAGAPRQVEGVVGVGYPTLCMLPPMLFARVALG
jgi:hypothetical protein